MKVFVIGADGLIGKNICAHFRCMGTSRKNKEGFSFFDLAKPNVDLLQLNYSELSYVIICAASARIGACELDPEKTYACNVTGTIETAKQFIAKGVTPVLFSTDYVFDGSKDKYTEEDSLSPINEYGRQKAILEKEMEKTCKDQYLLLRLSKVYSENLQEPGFLSEITEALQKNKTIKAAWDQIFSPIWIEDLMNYIELLLHSEQKGVFNIGGNDKNSRYGFAKIVARYVGACESLIQKISLDDLQELFKRPKTTFLSIEKLMSVTKRKPHPFSEVISIAIGKSYDKRKNNMESNERANEGSKI